MSTIVKYKDNVLTTIENSTKTIKTANKWMEDNLTLIKTDDGSGVSVYKDDEGYLVLDNEGEFEHIEVSPLTVTANGTYTAENGSAYNPVRIKVKVSNTIRSIIDRSITNLTTQNLPDATTIGQDALRGCTELTIVDLPNVTTIDQYAFYDCTGLVTANFPNVTYVGQYVFHGCSSLENIHLDNFIGSAANGGQLTYFARYCSSLINVVFPSFTGRVNVGAFRNCTNLKRFDSRATSIQNQYNFDTTALDTLILRGNSVCTLAGTNSFNNSPFTSSGTGGTLYVPSALISQYQSATNWSTILGYTNNSIQAIEGSIYETQYADGTPISS